MSCESFPVIAQSYHSVIGCQAPLSLDCIAIHPKYAVSKPKNLSKLTGKKHQYIPIKMLKSPIMYIMNFGMNLDLLNSHVAGPSSITNKNISDTNSAKLAIKFHLLWFPRYLHLHLHHYCMKNSSRHKESNLLRPLNLLHSLIQRLR